MNMFDSTITPWPKLIFEAYKDTVATVHLWTHKVGKIRLRKTPWLNHNEGVFQIDMDFIEHAVNNFSSAIPLLRISANRLLHPQQPFTAMKWVNSFYPEVVQQAENPTVTLLQFLRSTYK